MKPLLVLLLISLAYAAQAQKHYDVQDAELQTRLQRAREAEAAGQYEDALKELREANLERNNRCYLCYLEMQNVYAKTHDRQKLMENAKLLLAVAPTDVAKGEAHEILGKVILAYAGSDPEKLHEAELEFRAAIRLQPQVSVPHACLGITLVRLSREQEGIEELNQYLASSPDGPLAKIARGLIANPRLAHNDEFLVQRQ
jgi:predicted Zn-dependent protease